MIGYKIGKKQIDLTQKCKEIEHLLYRLAAQQDSTLGIYNVGCCFEEGNGVPASLDRAAEHYKKALERGEFDAKEWLDKIFDETVRFKALNKQYRKHKGDYEEFKN
jgi:TPR repeat protein